MLGAVDAVRREQLGGAQHRHVAEQLRADFVLPAVAAVVLQVDGAQPHAVGEQGEQRVGLVVGMRRRLHESARNAEFAQRQAERDVAAVLGHQGEIHAILRGGHADHENHADNQDLTFQMGQLSSAGQGKRLPHI